MQSRSYNQLLVAAGKKFDVPESTCLAESKIKTEIRGAEQSVALSQTKTSNRKRKGGETAVLVHSFLCFTRILFMER